jgi:hypothetical protein
MVVLGGVDDHASAQDRRDPATVTLGKGTGLA